NDSAVRRLCWRTKEQKQATGPSYFRRGKFCADCAAMTSRWRCGRRSTFCNTRSRVRNRKTSAPVTWPASKVRGTIVPDEVHVWAWALDPAAVDLAAHTEILDLQERERMQRF